MVAFLSNLAGLPLAPPPASGPIEIENPGNSPAFALWEIEGPCTAFTATSGSGEVLSWAGSLAAGQTLTIDGEAGTCVDQTGTNRYHELGDAPRFWMIPPGISNAVVDVQGTVAGQSSVTCSWYPRKRLGI